MAPCRITQMCRLPAQAVHGQSNSQHCSKDEKPVHVPISFDLVAAHAAHSGEDTDARRISLDIGRNVNAFQAAVLRRTSCRADRVAWWVQLHLEAMPGKALALSSSCQSAACAASMMLHANLSAAETLFLSATQKFLEDVLATFGTGCTHPPCMCSSVVSMPKQRPTVFCCQSGAAFDSCRPGTAVWLSRFSAVTRADQHAAVLQIVKAATTIT
jgi:hypothetical protein